MEKELTRATVRPWRASDAESLAIHANDKEIWLNLRDRFPHPYGVDDARSFLKNAPDAVFCIAVDDVAVGGIGLSLQEDVERFSAELGYWLGRSFWGQGITTEAICAVTEYAFESLGLQRIFALPYAHNRASQRALEKAGYACEGRMRNASFKDGKFVDQFIYARLKDDGPLPARHVLTILAVRDLAASVAFYDAAFAWPHSVEAALYVEMTLPGGQRLGLYEREGFAKNTGIMPADVPDDAISATELYLYVSDLSSAVDRLRSAGAKMLSEPSVRDWGDEAAYFRDPFGNVVVIAKLAAP